MGSELTIHPSSGPLRRTLTFPGDKSISHRALILGAIATGRTTIKNLLEAEDVLRTVEILRQLGVTVLKTGSEWVVTGRGLRGLSAPARLLDCGNSGTTLRLMTGLLSGFPFTSALTGDASLNRRPMGRLIGPLAKMGAQIREVRKGSGRTLFVAGGHLRGGSFRLPVASAQLKSALLLAGLSTDGGVTLKEPAVSRDHTERMLRAFGAVLTKKDPRTISLRPGATLKGQRITVPGDFSSAAFFIVAALISRHPRTRLLLKGVGINPTRTGLLTVLKKMGGRIVVTHRRLISGEPVADLEVFPSQLRAVRIDGPMIPCLIDEIPILAVAAAVAAGKTEIRDAAELRVKESDRIETLAGELSRCGIGVKAYKDGLGITGTDSVRGAVCQSHGDHRIAMSMAILGTRGFQKIVGTDCINTSFPQFPTFLKKCGVKIQ